MKLILTGEAKTIEDKLLQFGIMTLNFIMGSMWERLLVRNKKSHAF